MIHVQENDQNVGRADEQESERSAIQSCLAIIPVCFVSTETLFEWQPKMPDNGGHL